MTDGGEEKLKAEALRLVTEEMLSSRYRAGYIAEVRRNILRFFEWTERKGICVAAAGKRELADYIRFVRRQKIAKSRLPLSLSTMNKRLIAVRHVYSAIYRAGMMDENPLHGIEFCIRSGRKSARRPLTQDEMDAFLKSIRTETPLGLRNRAMFELMYSSALRANEVASIRVGDIDFDRNEAIVRGKFDKDRVVPILAVAKKFLLLHLGSGVFDRERYVFMPMGAGRRGGHIGAGSVSRIFRECAARLGIAGEGISTHSIRHSTATHLLDNGASVRHVQELLGHKNIETTARYTHLQTEGLARQYRKFHPREHELFEAVDDEYLRRLDSLLKE